MAGAGCPSPRTLHPLSPPPPGLGLRPSPLVLTRSRRPGVVDPPIHPDVDFLYTDFRFVALGGSVAEWLACWTQAQKDPGSNRSRDAVE